MTMKTLRDRQRDQQRAERAAYIAYVLAQGGSVRQAAKLAGMRRPNFIRLRHALSLKGYILTAPAAADKG